MSAYASQQAGSTSTYALTLRGYQQDGVGAIRSAFSSGARKVCYVLPTGGGKTVVFSDITWAATQKGSRVLIVAHRIEIVEQISAALTAMGVEHGMILAGGKLDLTKRIQLGMVQTVANRLDRLIEPSLLVIDEAHHAVAGTWRKLLDRWPAAYVLGVTATPERLDGQGLRSVGFEALVLGPDVGTLIEMGHLAKYRYLGADLEVSFDDVATVGGDYAADEVEALMTRKQIVGDVVEHYRKHLDGRTCIAFCVTVRHAEAVARAYNEANIPARSLDGAMKPAERREVVRKLRDGEIKVLTSCAVISEGFDAPSVGGAQLLRPTQSFAMFRQQIGRCLRPKPDGTPAIILDHVQNYLRHGLPDDEHAWDLDSVAKKAAERKAKKPMRVCRACGSVFPIAFKSPPCPGKEASDSGCVFATKVLPLRAGGELGEVFGRRDGVVPNDLSWAGQYGLESGYRNLIVRAKGMPERLRQIAAHRGYKPGWVFHQVNEYRSKTGPIWGEIYAQHEREGVPQ